MPSDPSEDAAWLDGLAGAGTVRDQTVTRLHELLLRVARSEARRRNAKLRLDGVELDDLAHQAAADALVAILAKLGQFRGESRFTTWAYRFVILEVSSKIGRHFWQRAPLPLDAEDWDRLPDRFGMDPADAAEWGGLVVALRQAIDEQLTERQRRVFVAIVLIGTPMDALVIELSTNRNAIYKTMFDARRKLRAALGANGYTAISASPAARETGGRS